jgi:hypothetical protein
MPMPKSKPNSSPDPIAKPSPAPAPGLIPTPTLTLRATSAPKVVKTSAPTPTRQWEMVPPRNQTKLISPAGAQRTGSSIADRSLIVMRDESVPLRNKMVQEIASVIHRALFHQEALALIRIMNVMRNAKGTMMASTDQNATGEMAMLYRDIIITAATTVHRGVADVEGNETCEWPKMHAVPLLPYMGKGMGGL